MESQVNNKLEMHNCTYYEFFEIFVENYMDKQFQ